MCFIIYKVDDGLQPSRAINAVFLLAVKTWSACTSPLIVQVMMAIVFVRSIPFTTSSKEPASAAAASEEASSAGGLRACLLQILCS